MGGQRPELKGPPELFYNEAEAKKYSRSSRYTQIQRELAFRAYELLALPQLPQEGDESENDSENSLFNPRPCVSSLLLDIGVGSGICAAVLGENNHKWVGIDISRPMLNIARSRMSQNNDDNSDNDGDSDSATCNEDLESSETSEMDSSEEDESCSSENTSTDDEELLPSKGILEGGDLILGDMGNGLGFRPGSFDGAISISALQWLCNADSSTANPRSRLTRLFTTLYSALNIGARAVFQFYPENAAQIEMILNAALKVGFNGGMVVDYPDIPRRKKYFLVLMVGYAPLPAAKGRENTYQQRPRKSSKKNVKDKAWVLRKKELRRKRGHTDVPEDTKYTARKRRPRF